MGVKEEAPELAEAPSVSLVKAEAITATHHLEGPIEASETLALASQKVPLEPETKASSPVDPAVAQWVRHCSLFTRL